MNTMNLATRSARISLEQLLHVDALTCLASGLLFVMGAAPLSALLGLPVALLFYAGIVLFPCAALMLIAARSRSRPLVWAVILGNFAWAAASVIVAIRFEPTTPGTVVIVAQAAVVAVLGFLEWRARI